MLEVLAMLAIAGIIGAAGVGGYTVAMKKHRANELIHEAAGRALAVSQQLAVDRKLDEIDFGGYPNNDTGHGKFSDKPIPLAGGEFFKIPITGMDQNTCEQLKVMAGGSLRRVDCKDDENGKVTADLIYQKDLSASVGTIPGDTSGSSSGGNTATHSYDNDREGCEGAGYQYCSNNICITKEEVCETGSALCADTYPGTSEDNTGGYAGEVEGKTCRCPSQQAFNQNDKKCIPACSGHGTLNENEDCVCQGGYCGVVCENQVDCGEHGTWTPDKCECDANWYGPLCDSTCDGWKRLDGALNWGDCYSCSESQSYLSSKEECARCSNRQLFDEEKWYWDENDIVGVVVGYCGLKDCGKNAYRLGNLRCFPCEGDGFFLESTSKEECDKCSNRELVPFRPDINVCFPKCETVLKDSFRTGFSCKLCSDTTDPYFIYATAEDCAKCEGTDSPRYMGKLFSITDEEEHCCLCSSNEEVYSTPAECDRCGNLRIYDESTGICKKA